MLICEKCNKLYEDDELPKHVEHHPYGNGTADEVVEDYECSCGGEIEEAVACDRCGEWYPITSDDLFGNAYTICRKCYDDMYSSEKIVKIAKKQNLKSTVEINEVLAYAFPPDEIERILYKELHLAMAKYYYLDYIHTNIMAWASEDMNNTVDELFDLEKEKENDNLSK